MIAVDMMAVDGSGEVGLGVGQEVGGGLSAAAGARLTMGAAMKEKAPP
jgi:hypothetical protein